MRLNFNFSSQLMLTVSFLNLVFKDHFQGHDVFTALLACQIDVAKFTFAKSSANFKVIKAPFFSIFTKINNEKKYDLRLDPFNFVN